MEMEPNYKRGGL